MYNKEKLKVGDIIINELGDKMKVIEISDTKIVTRKVTQ